MKNLLLVIIILLILTFTSTVHAAGWVISEHTQYFDVDKNGQQASICKRDEGHLYSDIVGVEIMSTWGVIEQVEGQYNWSDVDQCVNYWAARGKQIFLRIATVSEKGEDLSQPEKQGTPYWLFHDYGVPYQIRFPQNGNGFYFPDQTNEIYLAKLTKFLEIYAGRYKDDPRIAGVDLATYGRWGEWHDGWEFSSKEERLEALKNLLDIWTEAWEGKKPLRLPLSNEFTDYGYTNKDYEYEAFKYWNAYEYALTKPMITYKYGGTNESIGWKLVNFINEYKELNRNLPLTAEFWNTYQAWFLSKTEEGRKETIETAVYEVQADYFVVVGWSILNDGGLFYQNEKELMQYALDLVEERDNPKSNDIGCFISTLFY